MLQAKDLQLLVVFYFFSFNASRRRQFGHHGPQARALRESRDSRPSENASETPIGYRLFFVLIPAFEMAVYSHMMALRA